MNVEIRSLTKVLGTAITVGGAVVIASCKGPALDPIKSGGKLRRRETVKAKSCRWALGHRHTDASGQLLRLARLHHIAGGGVHRNSVVCARTVMKGKRPVYVTAFRLLCTSITAALGSIVLAENVHLGRVIGAVLIILGLYIVVWAKSKQSGASSDEKD